ncbi:MAG: serine/threonine protein kinase [Actinobacteria bacterium]|nr:serine/threonine protein kinase [Actinomycetota bacterium]
MPSSARSRSVLFALATLLALVAVVASPVMVDAADRPGGERGLRTVMFVGNNHDGTADVIDAATFEVLHRVDMVPDREERLAEIHRDPVRLGFFLGIRHLIGQGNDQFVDDMFTSPDGAFVYASRPSLADVVAIELKTGAIAWRFPMEGQRSDHMAISPDGTRLLVSDSTANKVHQIDTATGERTGEFPSGDSPHENEYYADATRVLHASIGRVYTPTDRAELGPVRDVTKGEEFLQVVDADTLEILKRWDIGEKLDEFGEPNMSGAVRPMALAPDERTLYFQVSFHHGFVEFDLETEQVTRIAHLPLSQAAADTPREQYLLDSAHHGLAMDPTGQKLCAAGTMSDYAAIVDRETFVPRLASYGSKPYWSTTGPTGEHCWVSYSGDDQVAVIDYATEREIARIDVGDHPQRVRAGVVSRPVLARWGHLELADRDR